MKFKPDESQLIAYLYGELQGEEKLKVEQYLTGNQDRRKELESMMFVRQALGKISDKEVIAPPIVMDDYQTRSYWNSPFTRMILGIAASLTLLIVVAKWTGLNINYANEALTIGFGETGKVPGITGQPEKPVLSANEVQEMINASLVKNNENLKSNFDESQQRLDESIRKTLASRTDAAFKELVNKTSQASEEQIQQFALALQADNARMIKDYLTLNSSDQRKYIESLLVDFAKYMEEQQKSNFQALHARVNSLEQNTDLFKYETEQILTSIISSVDNTEPFVTKN